MTTTDKRRKTMTATTLKPYRIVNTDSGADLGVYTATSERDALDVLARDAGHADHEDACEVTGTDCPDPALLVTELSEVTVRIGGEDGEPKRLQVIAGQDGRTYRAIDPESDPTADAVYVFESLDDLAEQASGAGHWLDGYVA